MAENPVVQLNELYQQFCDRKIGRRELILRASGLGLSAVALSRFFNAIPASAQDASPAASPVASPAATYPPIKSITRDEYKARLAEKFPFTKDPGAAKKGGKLIMGESATSDLNTFNPVLANSFPTVDVNALMFEYLSGSSPVDGSFVPGLADSWEIASDGKTYTFHLHPGVTWHDGKPFTADDVVFSFDAQANPKTGSSYTSSFVGAVASYKKLDDLTVQVIAVDVFAPVVFLGNAVAPIVAKHLWESVPFDKWKADPGSTAKDPSRIVGTGAFKFKERNEADGTTTLIRNDAYYDGPPIVDQFIFQTRPDDTAAIEALRAGEVDFVDAVPPSDVKSLKAQANLDVALYPSFFFRFYGYNLDPAKTPLFQDVKVRKALFIALDRQSVVDNIQFGFAEVAQGTQPQLSPAYAPDQIKTKYTFDPEGAKKLLDDAGWKVGGDGIRAKDGTTLAFEVMYGRSTENDQTIAYMQQAWKAIGVAMTPNPVDFSKVLVPAISENFNYQIAFLAFQWTVSGDQSAMFSSDQYKQGFNFMKYSNPAVDKLNQQANRELDDKKRRQLLIDSANLVNEDLPVGILSFRQGRTGYNKKRLHNFVPNALGGLLWSVSFVWVES